MGDLKQSMETIQQNPTRFGLSLQDVQSRNQYLSDVQSKVNQLRTNLSNPLKDAQRNALFKATTLGTGAPKSPLKAKNNDAMIEFEQEQQAMIMRQQDTQMDAVKDTVITLREVAGVMGRELEDQSKLLEEMEMQVDATETKMQSGLKRVNEFITANAGRCFSTT